MSSAVEGAPPKQKDLESMNGKNTTIPAIPSGAVNGNNAFSADHLRKPSMNVPPTAPASFSGSSQPNPGNIQFGNLNISSPASGAAVHHASNSLGVNNLNPRVSSPQNSPSPIPQPVAPSGGRPPSALQGHTTPVTFGQVNGDQPDPAVSSLSLASCVN